MEKNIFPTWSPVQASAIFLILSTVQSICRNKNNFFHDVGAIFTLRIPHLLPPYGVVPPGIVISGILLPRDELVGVEQVAVSPAPHLVFFKQKNNKTRCKGKIQCLPMTDGSRSTKIALGTCLPALVSAKKVLNESSATPKEESSGISPSGWIPCSRQYSSQQALPICTPALEKIVHFPHKIVLRFIFKKDKFQTCPMWIEMHSLIFCYIMQPFLVQETFEDWCQNCFCDPVPCMVA